MRILPPPLFSPTILRSLPIQINIHSVIHRPSPSASASTSAWSVPAAWNDENTPPNRALDDEGTPGWYERTWRTHMLRAGVPQPGHPRPRTPPTRTASRTPDVVRIEAQLAAFRQVMEAANMLDGQRAASGRWVLFLALSISYAERCFILAPHPP